MTGLRLLCFPLILGLASCALAPAKVTRPVKARVLDALGQEPASAYVLLKGALKENTSSPESRKALGQLVALWKKEKMPLRKTLSALDGDGLRYDVEFAGGAGQPQPLEYFDEIHSASDYKVSRIEHHQREGVGAPLLALRENKHRERIENYYPPEVIARPLTAVLEADRPRGQVQKVRIQLLCPMTYDMVLHNGRRQPLAADFSMPWAAALARAGQLRQSAILDMLTPSPKRHPQLFLMEPYNPKKEPLIMIHGLLSTPLAWAKMSNDLWADNTIRNRYQVWHYLYNTSAPALYSARILRTQLKDLRKMLDPEGNDPAMQRTTLLVHSMGGLIAKGLVVNPGDAFWNAAFKVPPESLQLSEEDRKVLEEAFEWQPDRSIRRIIFVCTPHRGSAFADNILGRAGSWITRPPTPFREFFKRVSATNPGVFTPAYEALGRGRLDSVSALSPRQPTLKILADLPFPPTVQTHSIIGNRGRKGPVEKSSDGIVPYTSSHLPGAASELLVPTRHGAFRHPAAIAEILRILRLP